MEPSISETEVESEADRLLRSRLGPTSLAVALALVSTPFVAAAVSALSASPTGPEAQGVPPPIDFAEAVPIALVAVVTAGYIGGAIGGRFVRRAPLLGLLLAVAIAWPVAIATLPILPTLAGEAYATGYVCIDGCNPSIQSGEPLSGMIAYARSVVVATFFVTPIAIAVAIAIGAWLANRLNHVRVAAVLGLAAYTTIHQFSVLSRDAGWLPFLCLVLGALIWVAPSWARWERQKPSSATPADRSAPPAS